MPRDLPESQGGGGRRGREIHIYFASTVFFHSELDSREGGGEHECWNDMDCIT